MINEDELSELKELKHHFRVIDMMITMHSQLRDRNKIRALVLDIFILILSTILCGTVFLDPAILQVLGINEQKARIVMGICSISVFLLSVISLRVDWKQISEKHSQSAEILSNLKSECRAIIKLEKNPEPQTIKSQCQKCSLTMSTLPKKVPDKDFGRLKMKHKAKVELSKLIDKYPGSSLKLLRVRLWLIQNMRIISGKEVEDDR